jgi:hypothetical protein
MDETSKQGPTLRTTTLDEEYNTVFFKRLRP